MNESHLKKRFNFSNSFLDVDLCKVEELTIALLGHMVEECALSAKQDMPSNNKELLDISTKFGTKVERLRELMKSADKFSDNRDDYCELLRFTLDSLGKIRGK